MPTDSMSMPSAVRRVISAAATNTTAAMRTAIGMPSQKPEPSALNGGLLTRDDLAVGDQHRDAAARGHEDRASR